MYHSIEHNMLSGGRYGGNGRKDHFAGVEPGGTHLYSASLHREAKGVSGYRVVRVFCIYTVYTSVVCVRIYTEVVGPPCARNWGESLQATL